MVHVISRTMGFEDGKGNDLRGLLTLIEVDGHYILIERNKYGGVENFYDTGKENIISVIEDSLYNREVPCIKPIAVSVNTNSKAARDFIKMICKRMKEDKMSFVLYPDKIDAELLEVIQEA